MAERSGRTLRSVFVMGYDYTSGKMKSFILTLRSKTL